MGLLDRLFRRKKIEVKQEEIKEEPKKDEELERDEISQKEEQSVMQNYPDGLPLSVLKVIDYKKFGLILKQKNLIPPSYDKNPVSVKFGDIFGIPRVVLTFKSKTSENFRYIGIYKYNVSYSKNINNQVTVLEVDNDICEEWINFVNTIMWAWDRGFRYNLLSPISDDEPTRIIDDENTVKDLMFTDKLFVDTNIGELLPKKINGEIGKTLIQDEVEYEESIKEIAKWNKKAEEYYNNLN